MKTINLVDVVVVGDLLHIAQDIGTQANAFNTHLKLRHVEMALLLRLLRHGDGGGGHKFLSHRRYGEKRPRRQPPGIINVVLVGDQPPFSWAPVMISSNAGECLAGLQHAYLRPVW